MVSLRGGVHRMLRRTRIAGAPRALAVRQPTPQAETITALCGLVRAAAPEAVESIKWGEPVYELNGAFAFIKAATVHVTIGFWRGTEIPDPSGLPRGAVR